MKIYNRTYNYNQKESMMMQRLYPYYKNNYKKKINSYKIKQNK